MFFCYVVVYCSMKDIVASNRVCKVEENRKNLGSGTIKRDFKWTISAYCLVLPRFEMVYTYMLIWAHMSEMQHVVKLCMKKGRNWREILKIWEHLFGKQWTITHVIALQKFNIIFQLVCFFFFSFKYNFTRLVKHHVICIIFWLYNNK